MAPGIREALLTWIDTNRHVANLQKVAFNSSDATFVQNLSCLKARLNGIVPFLSESQVESFIRICEKLLGKGVSFVESNEDKYMDKWFRKIEGLVTELEVNVFFEDLEDSK